MLFVATKTKTPKIFCSGLVNLFRKLMKKNHEERQKKQGFQVKTVAYYELANSDMCKT